MPVYFFQAGADGPIKIGFAANIAKRLSEMRVANAVPLVLRAVMPGERAEELALHIQFAPLRQRGEWFAPHLDLLSFIDGLPLTEPGRRRGRVAHPGCGALAEWMNANGFDDDRLAAALEIDRSTASRFRRGKLLPSSARIAKIVELTNGAVQPNTFFGLSGVVPSEMLRAS